MTLALAVQTSMLLPALAGLSKDNIFEYWFLVPPTENLLKKPSGPPPEGFFVPKTFLPSPSEGFFVPKTFLPLISAGFFVPKTFLPLIQQDLIDCINSTDLDMCSCCEARADCDRKMTF